MNVTLYKPGAEPRAIRGPFDANAAEPGDTLVVFGEPGPADGARWAPAIGLAVLRGAHVRRLA